MKNSSRISLGMNQQVSLSSGLLVSSLGISSLYAWLLPHSPTMMGRDYERN